MLNRVDRATAWRAPRCARAAAIRTWATSSPTARRRPATATASTRRRCSFIPVERLARGLRRVPAAFPRAERGGGRRSLPGGVPGEARDGAAGRRLLLGHGGDPAQDPGRARYRGRLHRRQARAPDLRRRHAGRTGHAEAVQDRVRPAPPQLRRSAREVVLPHARPDHGEPPGQRRRHAVPLGHLRDLARAAPDRRGGQGAGRSSRASGSAPSSPRSSRPGPSRAPRTTTRTTCRRIRGGYTCHYLRGLIARRARRKITNRA